MGLEGSIRSGSLSVWDVLGGDPGTRVWPELQRLAPLYREAAAGAWCISRYDDVHRLLADRRLGARGALPFVADLDEPVRSLAMDVERFLARWPVFSDEPLHPAVREALHRVVAPAATRRAARRMAAWSGAAIEGTGTIESACDAAAAACLAHELGCSVDRAEALRSASDSILGYLHAPAVEFDAASSAAAGIADLHAVVETELGSSRDGRGLWGALAPIVQAGAVAAADLAPLLAQVVTGTLGPTADTMVETLRLLDADPALRDLVAGDENARLRLVDEMLRLHAPFPVVPRVVQGAVRVHGVDLLVGDRVFLLLAGANRDPRRFPRPDDIDLARTERAHLSFGRGPHACLGATLARLQCAAVAAAACRVGTA